MDKIPVKAKLAEGAILPEYKTEQASGFDFHANIAEPVVLHPVACGGGGVTIPTGVSVELPHGMEIQVRPRSGLAFNEDIMTVFGTIDSDYRGEIKARLWNFGNRPFVVIPGMRIAQGVLSYVEQGDFQVVLELSDTQRGEGGFGHTGTK